MQAGWTSFPGVLTYEEIDPTPLWAGEPQILILILASVLWLRGVKCMRADSPSVGDFSVVPAGCFYVVLSADGKHSTVNATKNYTLLHPH